MENECTLGMVRDDNDGDSEWTYGQAYIRIFGNNNNRKKLFFFSQKKREKTLS